MLDWQCYKIDRNDGIQAYFFMSVIGELSLKTLP
jgi:hypothetical protein